jgi:hypothetical protein
MNEIERCRPTLVCSRLYSIVVVVPVSKTRFDITCALSQDSISSTAQTLSALGSRPSGFDGKLG